MLTLYIDLLVSNESFNHLVWFLSLSLKQVLFGRSFYKPACTQFSGINNIMPYRF